MDLQTNHIIQAQNAEKQFSLIADSLESKGFKRVNKDNFVIEVDEQNAEQLKQLLINLINRDG